MKKLLKNNFLETIFAFGAVIAGGLLLLFSTLRFPNDDQFILYRYIDNIASGQGFVYNIGEQVLGSTTPLFTLVVAFFKYLLPWADTPTLLAVINLFFFGIASALFIRFCRKFFQRKLIIVAGIIFVFSLSRTILEGMETPLFLLLLFSFLNALFEARYFASSIFISLAVLTRPDAGLIAIFALIFWLYKKGFKETIRLVSVAILVGLPWLIFATVYFGSFIPQSVLTKIHSGDIYNLSSFQALKIKFAHLSRIYWGRIFDPDNILLQFAFNLLPFLALVVLGIGKIGFRFWMIYAIPFSYFLLFAYSNPIIFPWYLSQTEPLWIILSIAGVAQIFIFFRSRFLHIVIMILLVAGPVFYWFSLLTTDDAGSKTFLFHKAEYLKEHVSGESIGIADIGIVGYVTNAYIFDFIGLVNDTSVQFYPPDRTCWTPEQWYVIPPALIREYEPGYIVASTDYFDPCFYSTWFLENYELIYGDPKDGIWKHR